MQEIVIDVANTNIDISIKLVQSLWLESSSERSVAFLSLEAILNSFRYVPVNCNSYLNCSHLKEMKNCLTFCFSFFVSLLLLSVLWYLTAKAACICMSASNSFPVYIELSFFFLSNH